MNATSKRTLTKKEILKRKPTLSVSPVTRYYAHYPISLLGFSLCQLPPNNPSLSPSTQRPDFQYLFTSFPLPPI